MNPLGLPQVFAKALVLFSVFMCVTIAPAQDQSLDFGQYSGYGLMKGILGNDYTTPLAACITGKESKLTASQASFRVSIVSSANEYKQAFHVDQKAEATFLGMGGGEELHFGQNVANSQSVFDIIVEAYGQHDSDTVDNIKWDKKYQDMLDSHSVANTDQVRSDCGDRYIQTVFKETRLFAVLHVSKSTSSALTSFSGQAHGKVAIDLASAESSLGGDVNVQSANKAGAIGVEIQSEGLGGVVPTAAAVGITAGDGLEGIATKLGAYLSSLHDEGQPVKYRLTPLPGLSTTNLSDAHIFEILQELKSQYSAVHGRIDNVTALLMPSDPRRTQLKQADDDQLAILKAKLTNHLIVVARAHDVCRKARTLEACVSVEKSVGVPPRRSKLELQPLVVIPLIMTGDFSGRLAGGSASGSAQVKFHLKSTGAIGYDDDDTYLPVTHGTEDYIVDTTQVNSNTITFPIGVPETGSLVLHRCVLRLVSDGVIEVNIFNAPTINPPDGVYLTGKVSRSLR